MSISAEFVETAGQALAEHCPKASNSPEAVERIKAKILGYDSKIGQPSVDTVLSWGREEERKLQAAIDADNAAYEAERSQIAARRKEREEYLSGSSVARGEVFQERGQRIAEQPKRLPFKPRKNWSPEEIDAMDSTTYAREIMGIDPPSERQAQGDSVTTFLKPERPGTRKGRTTKLPAEEIASREYREKVIQADKDERKALQKALRTATKKEGRQ